MHATLLENRPQVSLCALNIIFVKFSELKRRLDTTYQIIPESSHSTVGKSLAHSLAEPTTSFQLEDGFVNGHSAEFEIEGVSVDAMTRWL